jgi:hypothetical protein
MKNLLLLIGLLISINSFTQPYSSKDPIQYPSTDVKWVWEGAANIANVTIDTIIQGFINESKEVEGLGCSCTFDISLLNTNTSVIKLGGSNILLTGTNKYYGFVPFSDSIILSKITYKQTIHSRGQGDVVYQSVYQKPDGLGFEKPAFLWIKNTVTSGYLYWRCIFYKKP